MKRALHYVVVIGLQAVGSMLSLVAFFLVFKNLWALPFIAVGFILWGVGNRFAEQWGIDIHITAGGDGD